MHWDGPFQGMIWIFSDHNMEYSTTHNQFFWNMSGWYYLFQELDKLKLKIYPSFLNKKYRLYLMGRENIQL